MKIEDVIAAASEELNTSYENNALWFEVLINQAIRSHKTTKKNKEYSLRIKVQDNKAELPTGWVRIMGIYNCVTGQKLCPDIDYCIQDNIAVFDSSIGLADGTAFRFLYMGINQDEHGNLIIPEDWERMLVAYIGWKYSRRYIKDSGVAVMQNYQREYQTQKLGNI